MFPLSNFTVTTDPSFGIEMAEAFPSCPKYKLFCLGYAQGSASNGRDSPCIPNILILHLPSFLGSFASSTVPKNALSIKDLS